MQERRCDIKREGKFKECNKAKNEHVEKDENVEENYKLLNLP